MSIVICGSACVAIIASILFFPQIRIAKRSVEPYWLIALIGAVALLVFGLTDIKTVSNALVADSAISPIKILVLFISMSVMSIFLDEVGFFSYLANRTLNMAKTSQTRLFTYLYLTVSVLTVFTSNDIIILTFTPFICYFSKNAKISPIPYLVAEFVAANTWSMALIIGNPTNVYLATSYGVGFLEYTKVMLLPTIAAGIVALVILRLLFHKKLAQPLSPADIPDEKIKDKVLLIIGLVHLGLCTLLLTVSSYVGIDMWLVSLVFAVSLFITTTVANLVRKHKLTEQLACAKRAPWQLIPFVISMFIMILTLSQNGTTAILSSLFGTDSTIFRYGCGSFLFANIINNIPMSVLFCTIINPLTGITQTAAVYAAVIGSNLGALLTPIGALAGIMWTSILKKYDVKYSFTDFIKFGAIVSIPTLFAALAVLSLMI